MISKTIIEIHGFDEFHRKGVFDTPLPMKSLDLCVRFAIYSHGFYNSEK
jgi:hypothetical protein